ncbi:MAG: hypothetical protein DRH76_05605 [Deltaproteobacteria bacterium]|nr:MAG: hypothetical protein DRH76_05605 [Deltaproteobacteria bacterium]
MPAQKTVAEIHVQRFGQQLAVALGAADEADSRVALGHGQVAEIAFKTPGEHRDDGLPVLESHRHRPGQAVAYRQQGTMCPGHGRSGLARRTGNLFVGPLGHGHGAYSLAGQGPGRPRHVHHPGLKAGSPAAGPGQRVGDAARANNEATAQSSVRIFFTSGAMGLPLSFRVPQPYQ